MKMLRVALLHVITIARTITDIHIYLFLPVRLAHALPRSKYVSGLGVCVCVSAHLMYQQRVCVVSVLHNFMHE